MKMKHNSLDKLWNTIQLYLDGQLSKPERLQFEQRMAIDKEIQEMVAYFKHLDNQEKEISNKEYNISQSSFNNFIEQKLRFISRNYQQFSALYALNNISKRIPFNQNQSSNDRIKWDSIIKNFQSKVNASFQKFKQSFIIRIIAFSLLIIPILFAYHFYENHILDSTNFSQSQEELMSEFGDYPFSFGGGDNTPGFEQEFKNYYKTHDYNKALETLSIFLKKEENVNLQEDDFGYYAAMNLYKAICLIHLNKIDSAINILRDLNNNQNEIKTIEDQAIPFYLGFAYLMNGNSNDAKIYLKSTLNSTVKLSIESNKTFTLGTLSEKLLKKIE